MGLNERKELFTKLETELQARVLALVTGDRQHMETRVAADCLPLVSEHLSHIGPVERLALFLYTPGGDSIAGWGLVHLLRQYCQHLSVVVPFRALSCGTLMALGADEILMGRHGLLSPIDPSVGSPYNPPAPGAPQPGQTQLLPVSVEDMVGFLDLARIEFGVKSEASLVEILKVLADKVHPLALGAVYRAREQSSDLAKRLLGRQLDDEAKVDRIVRRLSKELPTHNYLIGREEARAIELPLSEPTEVVEELMWALYKEYEGWLELTRPMNQNLDLGEDAQKRVRYDRAAIESMDGDRLTQYIYITDKELMRLKVTVPGTQVTTEQVGERLFYQGWAAFLDGEVLK